MKTLLMGLFTRGVHVALEELKINITRLLSGTYTKEDFTLSKQYFKKAKEYSNPDSLPHVQVALRTREQVGSRIDFYVCIGDIGASLAERAFSPQEAQNKHLDIKWYYTRMRKVLKRLTDQVGFDEWTPLDRIRDPKRKQRDKEGFMKLFKKRR